MIEFRRTYLTPHYHHLCARPCANHVPSGMSSLQRAYKVDIVVIMTILETQGN